MLFISNAVGQIYCPADITASCFSSLTIQECGNATVVSGNYNANQVKYIDDKQINACNEGQVFRRFYLDVDYSNSYSSNEPSCIQTITLEYDAQPLNIQYPSELVLDCVDEIPDTSPSWSYHPCDLVGYSFEDEIFEFEAGACLKVIRTFSVINWCEYEGTNGAGLYSGTQVIKIIDNVAPEIENCDDLTFDAVENCEASITLTNIANDTGDCPSGMVQWTLSVDLWADGTEDLYYGPNEPQPFRINKIANGDEISITLPEAVGISNHKLIWKVTDGCGNVRSCNSRFEVIDNKPPTPYCKNYLSASLNGEDGGQLVIPASIFDHGAIDNCSSQDEIRISFSDNVNDTERIIECGEIGFQFYRIYYTDQAGNQDFCEVYMFVLDNGSCAGKFEAKGRVETRAGIPIVDASSYLMDAEGMISEAITQEDGDFSFGEQDMMETYYAKVSKEDDAMEGVDVLDYQLMLDAALGLESLDFYQKVAADLNEDGVFDLEDLKDFRDVLIGKSYIESGESWKFIPHSQLKNNSDAVYNSEMSILDYEEGFNFWAVKKGDLTGARYAESTPDPESIKLTMEIYNNEVVIRNSSMIKTGFFSLDLNADIDQVQSQLTVGRKLENDSRTKIINLENEFVSYGAEEFNIAINLSSEDSAEDIKVNLIGDIKFINASHTDIANVIWEVSDRRSSKLISNSEFITDINIYPTIFTNQITIECNDLLASKLISMDGQIIPTVINRNSEGSIISVDENLSSGIYLLTVTTPLGDQVYKVVK